MNKASLKFLGIRWTGAWKRGKRLALSASLRYVSISLRGTIYSLRGIFSLLRGTYITIRGTNALLGGTIVYQRGTSIISSGTSAFLIKYAFLCGVKFNYTFFVAKFWFRGLPRDIFPKICMSRHLHKFRHPAPHRLVQQGIAPHRLV